MKVGIREPLGTKRVDRRYPSAGYSYRDGHYIGYLLYKVENKWRKKTRRLAASTEADAATEVSAWWVDEEKAYRDETSRRPRACPEGEHLLADEFEKFLGRKGTDGTVEPSTAENYRYHAERAIKFLPPDVTVESLTIEAVEDMVTKLFRRNYSSSTVINTFGILKRLMDRMVSREYIAKNPLNGIDPPRRDRKKRPGSNSLSSDALNELVVFCEALEKPTRVAVGAIIAVSTGARRGEVCALRWSDIQDGANELKCVWIRSQIAYTKEEGWHEKSLKSGGQGPACLPMFLEETLNRWWTTQKEEFMRSGRTLASSDYVLATADGAFYNPHVLTHDWLSLAKTLNLVGTMGRIVCFHDLRHTWATMYLAHGGDVKTAQMNLRHSDANITLNVYAAALPKAIEGAADVMDQVLGVGGVSSGVSPQHAGVASLVPPIVAVDVDGAYGLEVTFQGGDKRFVEVSGLFSRLGLWKVADPGVFAGVTVVDGDLVWSTVGARMPRELALVYGMEVSSHAC